MGNPLNTTNGNRLIRIADNHHTLKEYQMLAKLPSIALFSVLWTVGVILSQLVVSGEINARLAILDLLTVFIAIVVWEWAWGSPRDPDC